jgi:hypothetical protein
LPILDLLEYGHVLLALLIQALQRRMPPRIIEARSGRTSYSHRSSTHGLGHFNHRKHARSPSICAPLLEILLEGKAILQEHFGFGRANAAIGQISDQPKPF